MSDWFYWVWGTPRKTPDLDEDGNPTIMYMTDPYYFFLIVYPFWLSIGSWLIAGILLSAWIAGWMGWAVNLHMTRLFEFTALFSILGVPLFLLSYTVFQNYWVTIPDPDSAARQAFTKKTRYMRNGMVFIKWLGMKSWLLPGSSRLVNSAEEPGKSGSVEIWMKQVKGGVDRQFVKLQLNYRLDAHKYPRRLQRAFNDQFMEHRLERVEGDSWLSKIHTATNGTMQKIDAEIIRRLAALADAELAATTIESLIDKRPEINDRFRRTVQDDFMDEYGVHVLSASIEDVQDVVPEGGWIYSKSRASRSEQQSLADQTAANAEKDAEVVRAEAFRLGQEATLEAQKQVALKEVQTTRAQQRAAAEVAELNLQEIRASIKLLAADPDNPQRAFHAAALEKLTKLQPDQAIAVWNGIKDIAQAGATAMKGPETLVVGVASPGELRNVPPTSLLDVLAPLLGLPRPTPPATPTPPTTP